MMADIRFAHTMSLFYSSDDDESSSLHSDDLLSDNASSISSGHEYNIDEGEENLFATNDESTLKENTIHNVVFDAGSGIFKAGFAGEEYPSICVPTVVGTKKIWSEDDWRQQLRNRDKSSNNHDHFKIGSEALEDMMDLHLHYPVKRGYIESFEQIEALMEALFLDKLEVDPELCNVLITEPPMHSKKARETMAELLFEVFQVNGLHMMNQGVLSLYSSGRTTGLVVDSGDQVTHVVPIYDGYLIDHAVNRLNLGGRDVTQYLQRIMLERGYDFGSSAGHQIAREIKEHLCFVSTQYQDDMEVNEREFEKTYELPDGTDVTLGNERFRAAEILFNPMMMGTEAPGVAELTLLSYNACAMDVRESLRKQVLLCGGSTLFSGFADRLGGELTRKNGTFKPFKVVAHETRQFSSWMGGSVFASLSTFPQQVIRLSEYDEDGMRVLHAKKRV